MSDAISLTKDAKKPHRTSKSGAKANKKRDKGGKVERHNPRAFSVANLGKTKKAAQRNLDRAQKKEYVPQVDRTSEVPPPIMVVVMGPRGSGKTTLIRSLVKLYTGHNLKESTGPINVVSGKNRRITFQECPDDLCAMVDLAKVADLVLLVVDGSFGFEMETFEFLNILQVHGFPKVMGVLTHLDKFDNVKALRATKKKLKTRFWTEVYSGAKVFGMGGEINGKYPKTEIRNMALYLSRTKFRPLVWRNTHPYVVVDRYEDITYPQKVLEDPACDREVTMFGYVRGTHLKAGQRVHVIGAGDFSMAEVTALEDPCPLPSKEKAANRSLNKKESQLYAPLANIGSVRMDQDAMYIDIGRANYTRKDLLVDEGGSGEEDRAGGTDDNDDNDDDEDSEEGGDTGGDGAFDGADASRLLRNLQDVKSAVNEKMKASELRLFGGGVGGGGESKSKEGRRRQLGVGQRAISGEEAEAASLSRRKFSQNDDDDEDSSEGEEEEEEEQDGRRISSHSGKMRDGQTLEERRRRKAREEGASRSSSSKPKDMEVSSEDDEEEGSSDDGEYSSSEEGDAGAYRKRSGEKGECSGTENGDNSKEDEEDDDNDDDDDDDGDDDESDSDSDSDSGSDSDSAMDVVRAGQRLKHKKGLVIKSQQHQQQEQDGRGDGVRVKNKMPLELKVAPGKEGGRVRRKALFNDEDDDDNGKGGGGAAVRKRGNKEKFAGQGRGGDEDDDDDDDEDDDDDDDEEEEEEEEEEESDDEDGSDDVSSDDGYEKDDKNAKYDQEEDMEHEGANSLGISQAWKTGMATKAAQRFLRRKSQNVNLQDLVYGRSGTGGAAKEDLADEDSDENDDEDLFKIRGSSSKKSSKTKSKKNLLFEDEGADDTQSDDDDDDDDDDDGDYGVGGGDRSKFYPDLEALQDWEETGDGCAIENLRNKFVTGDWRAGGEDGQGGMSNGRAGGGGGGGGDDDVVYGDFEDLQTGDKFGPGAGSGETNSDDAGDDGGNGHETERERNARLKAEAMASKEEMDDGEEDNEDGGAKKGKANDGDEEVEDDEYLKEATKRREDQQTRNRKEFEDEGEATRLKLAGFPQGRYVRIRFTALPAEFVVNFRPENPVVIGGLMSAEEGLAMVRTRAKRHRWHAKTLKSNDPLVISAGWRRFQTQPVFALEDPNERQRYLKYTPEHMHCFCYFYGPVIPQNTGIMAFQSMGNSTSGFRVSMTGTALELDAKFEVVKKLKLVGYPDKIFKKTAFIKGMFNSDLEVAKFEGAAVRTVSGIRGQLKKSVRGGEPGRCRATFEDKILKSDVVFCRLWVPVEIKNYYNPVTSLLEKGGKWEGMRNTAQLRRQQGQPIPVNKDSLYKPIERAPRKFNPLPVPKKLQAQLPFASKPKLHTKRKKKGYLSKRAVVMEPAERRKVSLMQALSTIRNEKVAIRKQAAQRRKEANVRKLAKVSEAFDGIKKDEKKRKYRAQGKEEERLKKARNGGGGGRGGRRGGRDGDDD